MTFQIGCAAVLLGSFSVACLLTAIVTDLWVHTAETVTAYSDADPASGMRLAAEARTMHFNIGLWRICSTVGGHADAAFGKISA